MDSPLIPEGVKRCSPRVFFFWTLPWIGLLLWGGVSAILCLWKGLNQTNMSNIFAFALWIVFDLGIIALGAGAFFTGFLTYIIGKKELKNVINAAVIIGFICYSGAVAMLGIDIGQTAPARVVHLLARQHTLHAGRGVVLYYCLSRCPCNRVLAYYPGKQEDRRGQRTPFVRAQPP